MHENNHWVAETLGDRNIALIGYADLAGLDPAVRMGLPYGISIAIALDRAIVAGISQGPAMEYYDEYCGVSRQLKEASDFLAVQIRKRGFNAESISWAKQNAEFRTPLPLKTLATKAGLGWIGRSAAFITKQYGNAIRLGGILTDMPLVTGVPVESSSCGNCRECVTHCPGGAISGKLWDIRTDRDDLLDARKCKATVIERGKALGITEGSCGVCLAVCPFTKKYVLPQSQ